MKNHAPRMDCIPGRHMHLTLGRIGVEEIETLQQALHGVDPGAIVQFAIDVLVRLVDAEHQGVHVHMNGMNLFGRPIAELVAAVDQKRAEAIMMAQQIVPGASA